MGDEICSKIIFNPPLQLGTGKHAATEYFLIYYVIQNNLVKNLYFMY